ncbi:MAG: phage tail sheath subtilisin-like domain-containing protein [Bacteroidota bacterium]|nr:phage tail sheath subtilisin-like domain-containing protein [Bacteroidota bacterium]
MSDFLHGVESINSQTVSLVNTVKTAVIGLIGTAATGDVNVLKLCVSEVDDTQFGTTGTIPEALKIIRSITKKTGATVFVVNIGTGTPAPAAADFVGDYDAETGTRTGLKLFNTCFAIYGFKPKIFIAPGFSSVAGVATALISTAESFRGYAYLDAPTGTTVSGALALRNTGGIWATTSSRAKLLFPELKDSAATLHPFSIYAAANRAKIDATAWTAGGGFWVSSSNWAIDGISGLETPITASINDATAETNLLNAQGITTCFNNNGADFREWGNRNASYPTKTDSMSFECCQRAKDITDESIELAMMPYIDRPIINAFIDNVLFTVNEYINTLISRGACIEGSKCTYDAAKNSTEELEKGHIVFTTTYFFPTPGERITFDTIVDSSLLSNLKA